MVVHVPAQRQGQALATLNPTASVVQARRVQRQIARRAQAAGGAVVHAAQTQARIALRKDHAAAVVQAAAVHLQATTGQQAAGGAGAGVDDGLTVGLHRQVGLGLHPSAGVSQCAAVHGQRAALAAQGAVAVVQCLSLRLDAQRPADHAAAPVGQPGALQLHSPVRLEQARIVIQRAAELRAQVAAGHDVPGTAVVQRTRRQGQLTGAGDHTVGVVVQRSVHLHLQGATGGGERAGLVDQAAGAELPRATQQQLALLVLQVLGDV